MNRPKILIISVVVFVFAAFLGILTLNYETNDDPLMMFISSGALNGVPDEHLQCIHLFAGLLLKGLYTAWPACPWYGILLVSVHLVSIVAIVFAALYRRPVTWAGMLSFIAVLMLGYEALFLVKMQFTSTAFIAGFAGVFILLSNFTTRCKVVVFLLLISIAFLLRREVFWPVMAFAGIAFYRQYARDAWKPGQVFAVVALAILLYGVSWWFNDRDPAYRASGYYPYHRATDIICNLPLDTTGNKLARYQWTPNDLGLLGFWFWVDDHVFTHEKITAFAQDARSLRDVRETARYAITFANEEKFALLLVLLTACFAGLAAASSADRRFIWLNLLLTAALLLYLVIMARAPKRVSTPLLFYMAMVALFVIISDMSKPRLRVIILAMSTLICVYKFWCVWQFSQEKKQATPVFANAIRHINMHPEDIFIVVSKGLPLDLMPVFQPTQHLVKKHNLIFAGWLTHLPAFDMLLEANGLTNLYTDIIGRENLVLVNGNIRLREILTVYYRQHYNTGISFEPYVPSFPDFPAYRIRFSRPLPAPVVP